MRRPGQINLAWLAFLGSVLLLAVMLGWLLWHPAEQLAEPAEGTVLVYCAASSKAPMEAIAREYEQAYPGVQIQLQYGASQTLLANMEVSKHGDLYLPADDSYLQLARDKGLIAETIPLATMTGVLAVKQGNPKAIRSLDDLLNKDVPIAQADPDATAIGKFTREALQKTGQWDRFKSRIAVSKLTVNDVANDIVVGTVDAGIVWDVTVNQYPGLEAIPVPQLVDKPAHVAIAVLKSSSRPTAALRFARYVAARDKGLLHFKQKGFRVVDGDPWAASPEINLFAGAMLKPAIEETITAFEKREGVKVTRVYNGCGILVSQMRAVKQGQVTSEAMPDLYFACDKTFMNQVNDLFLDSTEVSTNQLVILVPKGNPHGIKSLRDLGKKDLRVGIGHEQQCALGVLTQQTLIETKTAKDVMKNVKVQAPTGDMLVNQLLTGSLDAVVAYLSNATIAADKLDAIRIDGFPCAIAVQPIAVSKDSQHKVLTGRLLDAIRSRASQERFENSGFNWQAGTKLPEGKK